MELAQLAKDAAAGDKHAWTLLIHLLVPGLRNWLMPRARGLDVDEVVQDVVVVVRNKLTSLATGSDSDFVRGVYAIACLVQSVWLRQNEGKEKTTQGLKQGDDAPEPWLIPYLIRGSRLLTIFEELEKLPEFRRRETEGSVEQLAVKHVGVKRAADKCVTGKQPLVCRLLGRAVEWFCKRFRLGNNRKAGLFASPDRDKMGDRTGRRGYLDDEDNRAQFVSTKREARESTAQAERWADDSTLVTTSSYERTRLDIVTTEHST